MTPHTLHAGTRASGLAAGRHGWDLRLFAWLGGGHGARPRSLWWALACARWSSGPLTLLLLTGATGWARVYVGAHFPSDVWVGWALGLLCGMSGAVGCGVLLGKR